MEIVLLVIRLILFAVFALAGIGKLLDLKGSEEAAKAFGTPDELAATFAVALPIAELIFAVCFLFPETSWIGSIGALILLLAFIGGMIRQISIGKAPDCHCFGQIHNEPVGKKSLVRNIVFAILALVLAVQGRTSQGVRLAETNSEMIQIVLLLFIALAAVIAVSYARKIYERQDELSRRIDVLDLVSREGKQVERSQATLPGEGLPIGAPFPDLPLATLDGTVVRPAELFLDGMPRIFLFVSPSCEPCQKLLPELDNWKQKFAGRLEIVFVSTGSIEENRAKFFDVSGENILLQEKKELAETLNAVWTPTALFVGADGTIASRPATGDKAINELFRELDGKELRQKFVFVANGRNNGDGILVGKPLPSFEVKDTDGNSVSEEKITGRRTLAVFWSSNCPHCKAMAPELAEWDNKKEPNEAALLMFSDGGTDEIRQFGFKSPVVLESDFATAAKLGMHGTPSAVLVDENGFFASEPAIGAPNIWALLGKRK